MAKHVDHTSNLQGFDWITKTTDCIHITPQFVKIVKDKIQEGVADFSPILFGHTRRKRIDTFRKWERDLSDQKKSKKDLAVQEISEPLTSLSDQDLFISKSVRAGSVALIVIDFFSGQCDHVEMGISESDAEIVSGILNDLDFPEIGSGEYDTDWIIEQIKSSGNSEISLVLWETAQLLRLWVENEKKNASQKMVDFSSLLLLHDTNHIHRITDRLAILLSPSVLEETPSPYSLFLAYSAAQIHDLGYFLSPSILYPDLKNRSVDEQDRVRIHERQHQILVRVLLRLCSGQISDYPPFIQNKLKHLSQDDSKLAESVASNLADSARLLAFLTTHQNIKTDDNATKQQAVEALISKKVRNKITPGELQYLLASLRFADRSDRNHGRIHDITKVKHLLKSAKNDAAELNISDCHDLYRALENVLIESTKVFAEQQAQKIHLEINLFRPDSAANSSHSFENHLDKEFSRGQNYHIRFIEDYSKSHVIFSRRVQQLVSTELTVSSRVFQKVCENTSATFPGEVSEIFNELLIDCPRYNSWIKLKHSWHFLHGGEASIYSDLAASDVLKRLPIDLSVWGSPEFYTPKTKEDLHKTLTTLPRNYRKRLKGCLADWNEVSSEIYVPVVGEGKAVAVANIHFNGEHFDSHDASGLWNDEIRAYGDELARELRRFGYPLVASITSQYEAASEIIAEQWSHRFRHNVNHDATSQVVRSTLSNRTQRHKVDLGQLLQNACDSLGSRSNRVKIIPGYRSSELKFDPPLHSPVHAFVCCPLAFTQMLVTLLDGFSEEESCIVEYGLVSEMPLAHITIVPGSDVLKNYLLKFSSDFHSSDVFPTAPTVDWSDHPLRFACEARLLASISCGQIRMGRWSTGAKMNPAVWSNNSEGVPAFRIELPWAGYSMINEHVNEISCIDAM